MPSESKQGLSTAIGVGQIATMVIGFCALIYYAGQKSTEILEARTDIDKLAIAVNDLARAQASAAVSDATHTRTLEDIQRRLSSIESKIN